MSPNEATQSNLGIWRFDSLKRWKITAILETQTPLHIGSGEPLADGDAEKRNIKGFIKGKDDEPIIPGSSLKGKLRSYLVQQGVDDTLLNKVFGEECKDDDNQGAGGGAEFHDAILEKSSDKGDAYPNWCMQRKTYIEASTALERHTNTALDGSLHYTECVPPGTQFKFSVTGDMREQHAALIVGVLQTLGNQGIAVGADDANGKGLMKKVYPLEVKRLEHADILNWLDSGSESEMAKEGLNKLDNDTVTKLSGQYSFSRQFSPHSFDITLQFDGPFIINDPSKITGLEREPDHQPLTDQNANPVLPAKSFRGAFRSQAERIVRSIGGDCCDTHTPCKDTAKRCIVCDMFGATGWKSTINIEGFEFLQADRNNKEQQFVAIDRFHGGGKDTALFSAKYAERPVFDGKLSLNIRKQGKQKHDNDEELSWRKGLLGLVFRDLQEGDITFGFGANKGYGGIESADITNLGSIEESDIQAFREKCLAQQKDHACHCDKKPKSDPSDKSKPAEIDPVRDNGTAFHNPYHFIPVKPPKTESWTKREQQARQVVNPGSLDSHAYYRNKTDGGEPLHHGRIICKLSAETPIFVGSGDADEAAQGNNEAKLKSHYKLNGELAIPATSLRGMISSLTEASSNSAMRILDDGILTYRKPAKPQHILSALGMVTKRGGKYYLIPMALPTLNQPRNQAYYQLNNGGANYKKMFPDGDAKLKVYLNNAYTPGPMKTFLDAKNTWIPAITDIYYLPLDKRSLQNGRLNNNNNLRRPRNRNDFVIGQKVNTGDGIPVPSGSQAAAMTPGILRILGKEHRGAEIPNKKRHELFIPVPPEFVRDHGEFLRTAIAFPIPDTTIEKFEKIAQQRTDSQKKKTSIRHDEERLPFNLKGTPRETNHSLKIKTGDIVYFRPNRKGDEVAEIAFSSIWRDKVNDTVHAFVPKDLRPFNSQRDSISPAELLFGFVELNEDQDQRKHSVGFAGKVRVGAGTLSPDYKGKGGLQAEEIMLKALSSPKLPSPALYFKSAQGEQRYTPKADLGKDTHTVQGRKTYLHALRKADNYAEVQKLSSTGQPCNGGQSKNPWQTHAELVRPGLKVRINPVKKNTSFYFEVDFNNLTQWELGLLCYALKPNDDFRHKLGMGKPIGLGSVEITIAALQTIDRQQRYKDDQTNADRYNSTCWVNDKLSKELKKRPEWANSLAIKPPLDPEELKNIFIDTMDPDIFRAIDLLGNPRNIKNPVHYPQVRDKSIEDESFKWFVAYDRDRDSEAAMKPIRKEDSVIHALKRLNWNDD